MTQQKHTTGNVVTGQLKLVATHDVIDATKFQGPVDHVPSNNFFKSAQWSVDGTCVIAASTRGDICTFVIPPELLEDGEETLKLEPYSSILSHEPVDAVIGYSGFNLQEAATMLVLSAVNEHPIRLNSAVTSSLVASYPLVNPTTEAFIKPNSLLFTPNGSHFIAGSDSLISMFDLSRSGQEPTQSTLTGPKNAKASWNNPGASMRGIVSALAIDQQHNVLAAGTFTRHVGLYDASGSGECIGVFTTKDTDADKIIGGRGITQLTWSPCGRYLYIAERKSDGVMLYDIRQSGQLLGWLEGRNANTNQRLQVDLVETSRGHQIWAGGTDGVVRAWDSPPASEGGIKETFSQRMHEDVVNASVMHHSSSVLATTSGQRHFLSDNEPDGSNSQKDNTLKLWSTVNFGEAQNSAVDV